MFPSTVSGNIETLGKTKLFPSGPEINRVACGVYFPEPRSGVYCFRLNI